MDFYLNGMEISLLRYKKDKHNCVQNWKEYDDIVLEKHVSSVGCKTPFQPHELKYPICKTKETMKKAHLPLNTNAIPACREIEWIDYHMKESEGDKDIKHSNWFAVALHIMKMRFKITVQKREVDFQSLVGYVGGYVGIFLGVALAQIPELIIDAGKLINPYQSYFTK